MFSLFSALLNTYRRKQLEAAYDRYKASPGAQESIRLSRLLLATGRGYQAVKVISEAKRQYPDHAGVLKQHKRTKIRQAIASLNRIDRLLARDRSLRLLCKASDLACAQGDYAKAERYAEEAVQAFPEDWQSHFAMGKLFFHRFNATRDTEDQERALSSLDEAYQLNSEEYDVLLLLGLTLARAGEYAAARDVTNLILEIEPDDIKASQLLDYVEQSLRRASSAPAAIQTEERVVSDVDTDVLLERLQDIEGVVGLYLFDSEGNLATTFAKENQTFAFSDSHSPMDAMLKTCHLDVSRIGLGSFRSCLICGEGWQTIVRSFESVQVIGFFEQYPHGEALEQEIDDIVRASAVA